MRREFGVSAERCAVLLLALTRGSPPLGDRGIRRVSTVYRRRVGRARARFHARPKALPPFDDRRSFAKREVRFAVV